MVASTTPNSAAATRSRRVQELSPRPPPGQQHDGRHREPPPGDGRGRDHREQPDRQRGAEVLGQTGGQEQRRRRDPVHGPRGPACCADPSTGRVCQPERGAQLSVLAARTQQGDDRFQDLVGDEGRSVLRPQPGRRRGPLTRRNRSPPATESSATPHHQAPIHRPHRTRGRTGRPATESSATPHPPAPIHRPHRTRGRTRRPSTESSATPPTGTNPSPPPHPRKNPSPPGTRTCAVATTRDQGPLESVT